MRNGPKRPFESCASVGDSDEAPCCAPPPGVGSGAAAGCVFGGASTRVGCRMLGAGGRGANSALPVLGARLPSAGGGGVSGGAGGSFGGGTSGVAAASGAGLGSAEGGRASGGLDGGASGGGAASASSANEARATSSRVNDNQARYAGAFLATRKRPLRGGSAQPQIAPPTKRRQRRANLAASRPRFSGSGAGAASLQFRHPPRGVPPGLASDSTRSGWLAASRADCVVQLNSPRI
jgi:hypothetical protein